MVAFSSVTSSRATSPTARCCSRGRRDGKHRRPQAGATGPLGGALYGALELGGSTGARRRRARQALALVLTTSGFWLVNRNA